MPGAHRPMTESVFLDRSGRRRRSARLLGVALAVGLTGSLGLLVAGVLGGGVPLIPRITDARPTPVVTNDAGPAGQAPPVVPADLPGRSPTPAVAPTPTTGPPNGHGNAPTTPPGRARPSKSR